MIDKRAGTDRSVPLREEGWHRKLMTETPDLLG
jgi:hypothetical protein